MQQNISENAQIAAHRGRISALVAQATVLKL